MINNCTIYLYLLEVRVYAQPFHVGVGQLCRVDMCDADRQDSFFGEGSQQTLEYIVLSHDSCYCYNFSIVEIL